MKADLMGTHLDCTLLTWILGDLNGLQPYFHLADQWTGKISITWELVRNTDTQAPSRPPGSGSAGSLKRFQGTFQPEELCFGWHEIRVWRGSGKELVGDSAGGCFQKPRKGHRYSSAMPSALGTNMLSGVFLTCTKDFLLLCGIQCFYFYSSLFM